MTDRSRRSLLDFAIASSIAVVPVMLAIVLGIAWLRPGGAAASDRHQSVRQVAAMRTLEAAIVRRSAPAPVAPTAAEVGIGVAACRNDADRIAARLTALDAALAGFGARTHARVAHPVGVDLDRWYAAAGHALAAPIEAEGAPGRPFRLACADLVAALSTLTRSDAALLDRLEWRGSVGSTTLARWRPDQQVEIAAQQAMRRNPWAAVAGCVYLGRSDAATGEVPTHFIAGPRSVQRRVCAEDGLRFAAAAGRSLAATRPGAAPLPSPAAPQGPRSGPFGPLGAATGGSVGAPWPGAGPLPRPAAPQGPRSGPFGPLGAATGGSVGAPPLIALVGEPGPTAAPDDPRWQVPPSLEAMLRPLESLRRPQGGSNRVVAGGAALGVGPSIVLTIDAPLQALAQKTAACYTGRHDICRALGIRRQEDRDRPLGEPLLEGAMVRTAAVAIVDIGTGRIEALAGAMSPCARQEVDGPGRDAHCDRRLPYPVQYRADALLNPAVFHDAMPASTIKPIIAAAFLTDGDGGARILAAERAAMARGAAPAPGSLRGQLMRSDSVRFLDRMFCVDGESKGSGTDNVAECRRPWQVQRIASAFGWNAECAGTAAADGQRSPIGCGRHDLLFADALGSSGRFEASAKGQRPATAVSYGRLLIEPPARTKSSAPLPRSLASKASGAAAESIASMRLMQPLRFKPEVVRRCAAGADGRRHSDDDWEKCRGGSFVDVVAEGWGQGHSRASAVGVAGMMAALAAAANGQAEARRPHLVEWLQGAGAGVAAVGGEAAAAPASSALAHSPAEERIPRDAAEVILSGLSYSHRLGTARSACAQVFDAKRCRAIEWLAGKTGTPSFPNDGIALDELARACRDGDSVARGSLTGRTRASLTPTLSRKRERGLVKEREKVLGDPCRSVRPYKWYVAAYRADGASSGPWTKAIAVLTERNWLKSSGIVHGAGDQGPNPSAEIAMQIAGRHTGQLAAPMP